MAADPLGKTLFTGGTDNKIYSWDIFKGEKLKSFEGHTAAVVCMTVSEAFKLLLLFERF